MRLCANPAREDVGMTKRYNALTDEFELQCRLAGIEWPKQEYRFHPVRQWRFDYADPEYLLAVEIEGGTWSGGRHVSGQGYRNDAEKYNEAALLGWLVLRFTSDMVRDGLALRTVEMALRKVKRGEL